MTIPRSKLSIEDVNADPLLSSNFALTYLLQPKVQRVQGTLTEMIFQEGKFSQLHDFPPAS